MKELGTLVITILGALGYWSYLIIVAVAMWVGIIGFDALILYAGIKLINVIDIAFSQAFGLSLVWHLIKPIKKKESTK